MIHCPRLTRADVLRMAQAAEAEANERGVPASIAICDEGGHPLHLARLDGASLLSAKLAPGKARMSALCGRPSHFFQKMVDGGMTSLLSADDVGAMLQGGLPLRAQGHLVGGIAVSGGSGADDEAIAQVGADALAADATPSRG